MSLEIQEFDGNDHMARRLWRFDCDLYRYDHSWIPPFRKPYLTHLSTDSDLCADATDRQHFLAQSDGKVLGHISAFRNRELRDRQEPIGTLGYFECVDDVKVAHELFSCAAEWLRHEHSIARIWAPFNFDIWRGYRLMTRGFELESLVGEPRSKPYYPGLFHQFGFAVRKRWHSVELVDRQSIEEMQSYAAGRYQQIVEKGYRFQMIDPLDEQQMQTLYKLIISSYERFLGYTSPPAGTLDDLASATFRMCESGFSCLAVDAHDVPCGFSVAYVDQSAAVRAMRGRSGVWAKLQYLRCRRRHGGRVIFYLIGITPEEFHKKHGLGRAMFYATLDKILQRNYTRLVLAILAEDSPARRLVGRFMDTPNREYTLYEIGGT